MLDEPTQTSNTITPSGQGDFQIRRLQRVSTLPGQATMDADGPDNATGAIGTPVADDDQQGGFNGGGATQSWQSLIAGYLGLDIGKVSDSPVWSLVKRNNTLGVWVSEADGGTTGDDLAFFELDFAAATPTATKKELYLANATPQTTLQLAEDPVVSPVLSAGEADALLVDANGNLVIVESGFFDAPQGESRAFRMDIGNYSAPIPTAI